MERVSWIPKFFKISEKVGETEDTITITLDGRIQFSPGQFVQLSVPGVGEAPFSIASMPQENLKITLRKVGKVTSAIFGLREGDFIGVRGPFGVGYPLGEAEGRDILLVAGGIGLPPIRSVIGYIIANRDKYGKVQLLYGARSPSLLLYTKEYGVWEKEGVEFHLTVDRGDESWRGRVGVVTELFDEISVDPRNSHVYVCGPEIMMKFVGRGLLKLGFSPDSIFMSMERHMKCGVGLCGHCNIGPYYVCKDGPVFPYSILLNIPESGVI